MNDIPKLCELNDDVPKMNVTQSKNLSTIRLFVNHMIRIVKERHGYDATQHDHNTLRQWMLTDADGIDKMNAKNKKAFGEYVRQFNKEHKTKHSKN